MARDYGRIKITIWQDGDFTDLTIKAQQLYFYLSTQSKLDMVGIVPWRPRMAMKSAADLTEDDVIEALDELEYKSYVLLDEDTDELLVRSFIRSDEVLRSPNMAKAMVKAWRGIDSETLRGVVSHEVKRLSDEDPSLKGLEHVETVLTEPFIDGRENPFGKGFEKGSAKGCRTSTSTSTSLTTTSTAKCAQIPENESEHSDAPSSAPTSRASDDAHNRDERFAQFWKIYPIKRDKKRAYSAFLKALLRTSLETIIAGAERHRDDPNREDTFTKYAEGWLNGDGWDDEPLPPRKMTGSDQRLQRGVQMMQRAQNHQPQQNPFEIEAEQRAIGE